MDAAEPTGTLRRLECRRLASGQVQNIKWVISALAPRENRRQVWDGGAGRRAPPRPPSPSGAPCRERTGSQAQRDPRHTKPAAGWRRTRGARRTHARPQLPLTHARTHSHTHRLSHTYTHTRSHTDTCSHTYTHAHSRTHTYTHAHAHMLTHKLSTLHPVRHSTGIHMGSP